MIRHKDSICSLLRRPFLFAQVMDSQMRTVQISTVLLAYRQ